MTEHAPHCAAADGWNFCTCGLPFTGCEHQWLDRPESDSRECLICGTEVFG